MNTPDLELTIKALLAPGKGLLALDESFPTIEKRFKAIDIPSTEENRRSYREMLIMAPGLAKFVSGVILFDETLRQQTSSHVPMPEALAKSGIIPGIKVDKGTAALPNFPKEKITQGLDGLRERFAEYRKLGAAFSKWRAVISIGERMPTRECLEANANALALFAGLSQEAGLVPIVEPEVLVDGDHTIAKCEEVTTFTLKIVFDALIEQRVILERMLLKTGMVLSGKDCSDQADPNQVSASTLRCFRRAVPAAVPGIVFLSGGQTDELATERLNAICASGEALCALSFSFGRALQAPALKCWRGLSENVLDAQQALLRRAKLNSLALKGKYSPEMERTDVVSQPQMVTSN